MHDFQARAEGCVTTTFKTTSAELIAVCERLPDDAIAGSILRIARSASGIVDESKSVEIVISTNHARHLSNKLNAASVPEPMGAIAPAVEA